MVWWVDINESIAGTSRMYDKYDIEEERIFQTVNVMFNFTQETEDPFDIYALLRSGVNIFNIDLTIIEDASYKVIMKAIQDCQKLPQMVQSPIIRPVCISVTMSILDPVNIDKDIDVLILKDVDDEKTLTDFIKSSMLSQKGNGISIPVLLWLSQKSYKDDIDLIRASNGIILDYSEIPENYCYDFMQLCKMYRRPVFCIKPEISNDVHESYGGKRKLIVIASKIVNDGLHGIVISGTERTVLEQTTVVQNIVQAMRVAEDNYDPIHELKKLRKLMPVPQLVPMTVIMAAAVAAITSEAVAFILMTSSGTTARLMACCLPPCPIIAVTTSVRALRQMHLYRKVLPVLYKDAPAPSWREECLKRAVFGTKFAVNAGLFNGGAKLVVLAPAEEGTGYCDSFQIVATPFCCDE